MTWGSMGVAGQTRRHSHSRPWWDPARRPVSLCSGRKRVYGHSAERSGLLPAEELRKPA